MIPPHLFYQIYPFWSKMTAVHQHTQHILFTVKDDSDSERGNPLPPHGLLFPIKAARIILYAPSHRQDDTYHGLCYTSRGALAGMRNRTSWKSWHWLEHQLPFLPVLLGGGGPQQLLPLGAAPLDVEAAAGDDQLVEGGLGRALGSATCRELDEGALLLGHHVHRAHLAELVEVVPVRANQTEIYI